MLYRCPCQLLNEKNNNYRAHAVELCKQHSISIIEKYDINYIVMVLFEPGGFLDESIIIEDILVECLKNNKHPILTIYIIESPALNEKNTLLEDFLINTFRSYNIVLLINYLSISTLRQALKKKIDYLLVVSIDPYYYLYEYYHKNLIDDIFHLRQHIPIIMEIQLHAKNGFFYTVECMTVYSNIYEQKDYILKIISLGNNKDFLYQKNSLYYQSTNIHTN
jgi:hypothetical protein